MRRLYEHIHVDRDRHVCHLELVDCLPSELGNATKKHAVISTSSGWSFGYDTNGNMNSYKGNSIAWTSYNLPGTINGAGQSSQLWYGPNRNRWKQVATYPSGSETTIYVGGILEKVTVPTGTGYRHYVSSPVKHTARN